MTSLDLIVAPLAVDLVTCMSAEFLALDTANGVEKPRQACLRVGDRMELLVSTTQDECCSGVVWVRFVRMYPSGRSEFPAEEADVASCDILRWAVAFELGSARCVPVGTAETIPSCDDWNAVALALYEDQAALRRALMRFAAMADHEDRLMYQGPLVPMTVEGGCVGSTVTVTLAADQCDTIT